MTIGVSLSRALLCIKRVQRHQPSPIFWKARVGFSMGNKITPTNKTHSLGSSAGLSPKKLLKAASGGFDPYLSLHNTSLNMACTFFWGGGKEQASGSFQTGCLFCWKKEHKQRFHLFLRSLLKTPPLFLKPAIRNLGDFGSCRS